MRADGPIANSKNSFEFEIVKFSYDRTADDNEASIWSINAQVKKNVWDTILFYHHPRASLPRISHSSAVLHFTLHRDRSFSSLSRGRTRRIACRTQCQLSLPDEVHTTWTKLVAIQPTIHSLSSTHRATRVAHTRTHVVVDDTSIHRGTVCSQGRAPRRRSRCVISPFGWLLP